jgi:hypothetical protein
MDHGLLMCGARGGRVCSRQGYVPREAKTEHAMCFFVSSLLALGRAALMQWRGKC